MLHVLTACICLLTYFNIDFIRVHSIRCEARPVHINWHDKLSITREGDHSCGVLKGRSNFNQVTVGIRDVYGWTIATVARSLPVIDVEAIYVAGAVVAIHNVPGKGDVGAVRGGHLEVADMNSNTKKGYWKTEQCLSCLLKLGTYIMQLASSWSRKQYCYNQNCHDVPSSVQAVLYNDYTYPSKTFLSYADLTLHAEHGFHLLKANLLNWMQGRLLPGACQWQRCLTEGALQFIMHKVATAWPKLLGN